MKMIHMTHPQYPDATLEGYILDCNIPLGQAFDRPAAARYLWCSDGLSRYVPEDFMSTCMENSRSAKEALDRLIRAALLAGAPDNISAVCGFPVDAADRI